MCAAHAYHLLNLTSHSQQQYPTLSCADGAKHVCCKELLKYSKHKQCSHQYDRNDNQHAQAEVSNSIANILHADQQCMVSGRHTVWLITCDTTGKVFATMLKNEHYVLSMQEVCVSQVENCEFHVPVHVHPCHMTSHAILVMIQDSILFMKKFGMTFTRLQSPSTQR